MVAARIDDHIGAGRHMTFDAPTRFGSRRMKVMARRIILLGEVTLEANRISIGAQVCAMRIMAVAASDAFMEHSALNERAVLVYFSFDLAVGKVQIRIEQGHAIVVFYRLAMYIVLVNQAAPRMASRAHLDLAVGFARLAAM